MADISATAKLLMGQPTRLGSPFPGTSTPMPQPRPQMAIAQDLQRQGVIDQSTAESMGSNFAGVAADSPERLVRLNEMLRSGLIGPEQYQLYMQSIGR